MSLYKDIKTGLEQAIEHESSTMSSSGISWTDIKDFDVKDVEKTKCKFHRKHKTHRYTYHPITGEPISHDVVVGVCTGTRECDECSCGGNSDKCDFYPELRNNGREDVSIYSKLAVKALEKQLKKE